jgi:hypothetical protein
MKTASSARVFERSTELTLSTSSDTFTFLVIPTKLAKKLGTFSGEVFKGVRITEMDSIDYTDLRDH